MLRINSKYLLLLLLLISYKSFASNLYLMAGGGINTSYYDPKSSANIVGAGLNFKTDLGYNLSDHLSVEWSSQVKFNHYSNYLVWDTLMTMGLRYAFPYTNYYARASIGRSPTVIYEQEAPAVFEKDLPRTQLQGDVYGLAFGKYFKRNKNILFVEYGVSFQSLNTAVYLKNDGEVPVEIFSENTRVYVYSAYAIIGMRVF